MEKNVRLQCAHEQERRGARVANAQHSRRLGTLEVVGDNLQAALRRSVAIARVEWKNDRRLGTRVHVDGKVLRERVLHERHELLRQAPKHDSRVFRRVRTGQLENEWGNLNPPRLHRRREQGLLGRKVTEDGGRRHVHFGRDVGERRGLESLVREHLPGSVQKTVSLNDCRPAHL